MIAKAASKKAELESILRRRSAEVDVETDDSRPIILPIVEGVETDTNAPAKQRALGVSVDLGNLRPPFRGGPSSSGMPIREGIVNEKREVFSNPPDKFVIGDETMIERRFASSGVMETVLRDAQPSEGTMSSDTPRIGRSTTPRYQKYTSRSPVRSSSRKRDSGAGDTGGERYDYSAQTSAGERSQWSHDANQQAEMVIAC